MHIFVLLESRGTLKEKTTMFSTRAVEDGYSEGFQTLSHILERERRNGYKHCKWTSGTYKDIHLYQKLNLSHIYFIVKEFGVDVRTSMCIFLQFGTSLAKLLKQYRVKNMANI